MLPNLKIASGDLPERVIVCGDPGRSEQIAGMLGETRVLAKNREYHSYAGVWNGTAVAVVSHGVGAPGAAVCFEELAMGGASSIIRVGTAGSYHKEVVPGSLVISTAAARCEGLTHQLVPAGFPALADRDVVDALVRASGLAEGTLVKTGITLTLDAFYTGVVPFPHQQYKEAGVLAAEMENAALFVIAALRGMRAGAILAVDGYADADLREVYNPHTDAVSKAVELEAAIALAAITAL
ncbi:nucleoside phosphorylase [Ectobacillus ponti]|uniref:Uridine phosphorylase n=1 Tax=Ectobacillus ponti TaxID=2961894 RepID=A0AA42BR34_9BACI|nr:nucleoside phosphorylase [Ectobacillus ponti]MCP8967003.1 nucleoside phosphorylase [Ectobacillus ponti]